VKTEIALGDILANAISHGIGLFLALAGAFYLVHASTRGGGLVIASCSVFVATLVLVYLFSTLYHSLVVTRARHVFQILDHSAIYLLIAGTYTPFTLIALHGRVGWVLFGFVWTLAAAGVVFKSLLIERFAVASAVVYLLQGWVILFAIGPRLGGMGWLGWWPGVFSIVWVLFSLL
jgi:hemolysin III